MAEALHRSIEILRLIPQEPAWIDTSQIHRKLEQTGLGDVTPRTIQRTLESLSGQFALRCNDEVKPHKWSRLKESALIQIPAITPNLALTLKLAEEQLSGMLPHSSLQQLGPYFRAASQVLDSASAGPLAKWRSKVRALPRGPARNAPNVAEGINTAVSQALLEDRQLRLSYHRRSGERALRYVVHPLALVLRDSIAYLVCTIGDYEDIRQLVLHRIREAEVLDQRSRKSKDFDIDTYIKSGEFGYEASGMIRLEAVFNGYAAKHLLECPLAADQKAQALPNDRLLISATVLETNELKWWLLGYGAGVEIRRPNHLRKWTAREMRAALKHYGIGMGHPRKLR